MSATAPGGRPQEAATPVEALAADIEGVQAEWAATARRNPSGDLAATGRADALGYAARRIRRELAPAWDALAAGNERLRAEVAHLSAALAGENEGVRLWMLDCGNLTDKHRRERDEWQAVATGLRVSLESAASDQHRYRATLEEIRDGDSKYGDYARKLAREALGGDDA